MRVVSRIKYDKNITVSRHTTCFPAYRHKAVPAQIFRKLLVLPPLQSEPVRWHAKAMQPALPHMMIVVVLLLLSLVRAARLMAAEPIILGPALQQLSLGTRIDILEDTRKQWTIHDIVSEQVAALFTPSHVDAPAFGLTSSAYWVRFSVVNPSAKEISWYLEIAYPPLDRIDLYISAPPDHLQHRIFGDRLPFNAREVKFRNFIVSLQTAPRSQQHYYLRFENAGALNLPLTIFSPSALSEKINNEQLSLGIYHGAILIMLIYNLFIFLSVRDVSYLYYVLFNSMWVLAMLTLNGLTFQYLWPQMVWWANKSLLFFFCTAFTFGAQFSRTFLNTGNNTPIYDRILRGLLGLGCFGMFASLVTNYHFSVRLTTIIGLTSVIVWFTGVRCWWRGYRAARYYVIAWTSLILGIGVLSLKNFGLLPHNAFTIWAPQIGSAMEIILLSLGLADRIKQLQQRVAERTRELLQKNEELEKAKQAAETANRTKSIFLANMNHEIRTPLSTILGYADILRRETDLTARHLAAVNTISDSGRHLLGLINDVLDLSKIEAGRMELQESHYDLAALIDNLSQMFEMRCQAKGLAWHIEWREEGRDQRESVPSSRLAVHGDEGKLRQVLINLLSNAIKFTESGEVVLRIDMAQAADRIAHVTFHVIDTGIGIAEADQSKIFSAFDRVVSLERQEGTGLGLAIAQKQVALMGGHLAVESQLGCGSRFFFTLPFTLAASQGTEGGEQHGNIIRLAEGVMVKALVVDDVAHNRAVLTHMLREVGVEVATAENGQQALAHIAADRPDIVFMDIRMPMVDGVSAVQHILETYGCAGPKLVAVSASAMQHERERYLAVGFDAFLAKPIVTQQVYQCLASLLHVEFTREATEQGLSEMFTVVLPHDLYRGIKHAAETYRVTQLDRYFDAVAQCGLSGQQLAARLRERKQRGDMEGIIQLLAQLPHAG
jgi:signal transduction histidine kinase/CheY-like chemotaxis protein